MQRFDKYWIGIVLGLLMPALFIYVYIDHFHLWYTFKTFSWGLSMTFSRLLQVSVFPNLALTFVFYTTDTWRLSKGVLIGAMPYIIAAIALTF